MAADDHSEVLNINVGVLGHVDSGKTSLVKALSTLLSTAALDKSKQSRERGMTLDLGFSCFFCEMPQHLKEAFPNKKKLQITLVDCPGHASLIRTVIGGAAIIDMVLLIVDSVKGWQAQTTECLVLAELTSPHLVVALNKADQFPENERDKQLEIAKEKIRERLSRTRFVNAPMIGVAACVGGEKVAAVGADTEQNHTTYNMDKLVATLLQKLPPPQRNPDGPFYFSVDHCFPIRGRGTVLTGTVLNGSIAANDVIEFPSLGLERKIKSMQMFKKQVPLIQQGDRAGICVSNLDASLLERGIAATPGTVRLIKGAIALVRRVPYYNGQILCGTKFHISVGHTTIMATATFWGARELLDQQERGELVGTSIVKQPPQNKKKESKEMIVGSSYLGGDADMAGLPNIPFHFDQDFLQQDRLVEMLDAKVDLLHWCLLDFQTPVYCPMGSLVIGSRLDAVDNASGAASSCRLAFSGRIIEQVNPTKDLHRLRLYNPKERRGVISKLGEPHKRSDDGKVVRYELFGDELFKAETNMKLFVGMKIETESGDIGEIKSSYGTTGKFRVVFPGGTEAQEGDALLLRFKRFAHDAQKAMHQDLKLPMDRPGARIEVEKKKKRKLPKGVKLQGEITALKGESLPCGKNSAAIVTGFFAPEININDFAGAAVKVLSTEESMGRITGAFGKAGKCKVSFEEGISVAIGTKVELMLDS